MTSVATAQVVLSSDYATLWQYPQHKIVRHKFHKFIHGQEFRNVLEKSLELFQKYGANKRLSDDRKNSALPTEDMLWSREVLLPQAFAAGWRYWAIIMPDKVAGQMNMNRILKHMIDKGMVVQVFDDPDEAMRWLEAV